MKLFDPSEDVPEKTIHEAAPAKPSIRKRKPKCYCGCGKPAIWPRDSSPIFNTRLCGYLLAVKMARFGMTMSQARRKKSPRVGGEGA